MNPYSFFKRKFREFLVDNYPKIIVDREWPSFAGHKLNWKNPLDINEKIQWLLCNTDTSEWTMLADKYSVRSFVERKGFKFLLTKLYGVWDDANNIDFENLPQKFVLKCNHDSGSTIIVDKNKDFDYLKIRQFLNERLHRKFGYVCCEPHYNKIKPLIIAEQYLHGKVTHI